MSNTRKTLESRVRTLNMVLDRPLNQFSTTPEGTSGGFSVGHFCVDQNEYGYAIEEQVSKDGGVRVIDSGLTLKDANALLHGMLKGIALRNAQLANSSSE